MRKHFDAPINSVVISKIDESILVAGEQKYI